MTALRNYITQLIFVAGLAQILLVMGSFAIPVILKWRFELAKINTLIKQMFWTYAAYILIINLCFGVISVLDYSDLTSGTRLALIITGFIALYWITRIVIQFFYFDRASFPSGIFNRIAEFVLVSLFVFLSVVYSFAFYLNYKSV